MAKITNMKCVGIHAAIADGKKKAKGHETWVVEADGLGSVEVKVVIPALTHGLKDKKARDHRVRALVAETAAEQIAALEKAHAG